MPELPEVETFRRYFNATSLHQVISKVTVYAPTILKGVSVRRLNHELRSREFQATRRHGKYLMALLNDGLWLVMHFGMTGFLEYFKEMDKKPPHCRLLISFDSGYHLAYDCQRKLGKVTMIDDPHRFIKENAFGPDPMDSKFDFAAFENLLGEKRGVVKSALMNQSIIAGIGNIYSDEILFKAGIFPQTPVAQLDKKQRKRVYRAMKRVLKTAIDHHAESEEFPDSYITRHRYKDAKCPKCGSGIRRLKVSGRTSYYCPACQK